MRHSPVPEGTFSYDLHVLGLPPAFVLSQDQTLMFNPSLSHRQTLKINVCTFIWWLPQINQIKTEVSIKKIRRLQDAQTNAITLPAHPFLLINNVKELKGRNPKPLNPRRQSRQRRASSVEAGYRALTPTCKYLFGKKCQKTVKEAQTPGFPMFIRQIQPNST